ncbi:MAG: carbohydrate binding domain-containing protein [Bacillota bacterium]
MKKIFVLMLALTLTFALTACGEGDDEERTAPVIEGTEDVTIYTESEFDPMDGITATDHDGNDITEDITISGSVDTTKSGSNYLKYTIEDSEGLSSEANRYVTVEVDPDSVGDEMVRNGDFALGDEFWSLTTGNEGGVGTIEEVDGELKVTIETPSWNMWEPRLENTDITFEKDKAYEVTFDARADDVRSINVQVGEVLDEAPYFLDFKLGQSEIHELSTEMDTYSFQFMMSEDTNENGSLLFEMGTFPDDEEENLATDIYYDNITIEEIDEDDFVDDIDPVITGADDATIELGTDFDPLEGVSVTDNVDGTIELTNNHVTGEVDTDTEDDYTLTYTVSDEAGNEITHTRVITVVGLVFEDTGMIPNNDFSEDMDTEDPEWTIWEATGWEGAPDSDGDISISDDQLNLEVNDLGSGDPAGYTLQAATQVDYQQGHTYKAVFTASADAARKLNIAAGFTDGNDEFQGSAQEFDITDSPDVYEFIFTVEEDTDEFNEELKFEFGHSDETVYIEEIELLVLDKGPLQDNGTFEDSGWSVWAEDGIQIDDDITDEEYVITSDSLGSANWAIQFVQEGLALENGQSYSVTFDAKAHETRDINFKIIDSDGAEEVYTPELSTSMDTYTHDFTYEGNATSGKISIELGDIGDATPGTTTFDNISVVELDDSDEVVDDSELVTNGTFDEILDWGTWAEESITTSSDVVDGEYVFTYEDLGDDHENWAIQMFQDDREFTIGETYTFEFDMKADHDRDINAKIISGDYEILNEVSLTTDMTHYEYTFDYEGPEELANINFEFGNIGDDANDKGTITLDNVMLYRNFNPQD